MYLISVIFSFVLLTIITFSSTISAQSLKGSIYTTSKPYTRWWWFAGPIHTKDIADQLNWLKENNFGGAEIAWVYPLYKYNNWMKPKYDTIRSRPEWLSQDWRKVVSFTKKYADSIGLGCDFTFGTSWPEGDSKVEWHDRTQIFGDTNFKQTLTFTWEFPKIGLVINHMDKKAFGRFANRFITALKPALKGQKSALLCESWEIKLNAQNKLWTPGFKQRFIKRFGYDIVPYMYQIDSFPDMRYDYMKLVGEYVDQQFYKPFAQLCKKNNCWSRAECLGAPTDIMTTYSLIDIPETEAMLNEPHYSKIVSSSACLSQKSVVSAESFTCMYGFPRTLHQQEQTADLKMVADALFAQGVNQIFWHGMPYNPTEVDSQYFFATVHVGKKGSLSPDFKLFNTYMQNVCQHLKAGKTYSEVAVYIPFEDAVMKGALPKEKQRVWVWGEYELRYIRTPEFLKGYAPLWINKDFLLNTKVKNGRLVCGDASFKYLYVDVKYMEYQALKKILAIAKKGFPICFAQKPQLPGHRQNSKYATIYQKIISLPNVKSNWKEVNTLPFVSGDSLPDFWCRKNGDKYLLFFANPKCSQISYPIYSGQSFQNSAITRKIKINSDSKEYTIDLRFLPYQSLLLEVSSSNYRNINIEYTPPTPIVKPKTKEKMNF